MSNLGRFIGNSSVKFFLYPKVNETESVIPDSLSVSIFNSNNTSVYNNTFTTSTIPFELVIPETANTLAGNEPEIRRVELNFTKDGNSYKNIYFYVIYPDDSLEVMKNSFQTFNEALMTRALMGDRLDHFDNADDFDKQKTLMNAFELISRLSFYTVSSLGRARGENYDIITGFDNIDVTTWNSLPEKFRNTLKKAQILEADSILGGEEILDRRDDGIVSETVGESKFFFRNRSSGRLGLSNRTMKLLRDYLYVEYRVARG